MYVAAVVFSCKTELPSGTSRVAINQSDLTDGLAWGEQPQSQSAMEDAGVGKGDGERERERDGDGAEAAVGVALDLPAWATTSTAG